MGRIVRPQGSGGVYGEKRYIGGVEMFSNRTSDGVGATINELLGE